MNANTYAPGDGRNLAAGSLEDELVQDFPGFAGWAFSAEGLPDLQILAWGTSPTEVVTQDMICYCARLKAATVR
jgi:hypothetical protein